MNEQSPGFKTRKKKEERWGRDEGKKDGEEGRRKGRIKGRRGEGRKEMGLFGW